MNKEAASEALKRKARRFVGLVRQAFSSFSRHRQHLVHFAVCHTLPHLLVSPAGPPCGRKGVLGRDLLWPQLHATTCGVIVSNLHHDVLGFNFLQAAL